MAQYSAYPTVDKIPELNKAPQAPQVPGSQYVNPIIQAMKIIGSAIKAKAKPEQEQAFGNLLQSMSAQGAQQNQPPAGNMPQPQAPAQPAPAPVPAPTSGTMPQQGPQNMPQQAPAAPAQVPQTFNAQQQPVQGQKSLQGGVPFSGYNTKNMRPISKQPVIL
jgi:hypothetical protein